MAQTTFHYMTISLMFDRLDKFLNDLEHLCNGCYDIIKILKIREIGERAVVGVVIRFIITSELDFDKDEIMRKLGF